MWTSSFGLVEDEYCEHVCQAPDGGYFMTGHTFSYPANKIDLWTVKTDSAGLCIHEHSPHPYKNRHSEIMTTVGDRIVLRFGDWPGGFGAFVYDASGRKVDEIHSGNPPGTISWGEGFKSGVYFIRPGHEGSGLYKIILIR